MSSLGISATLLPRSRAPPALSAAMSPPSPSEKPIVVGCGAASVDLLATVATFPSPDDKIRSLNLKIEGGGNVGNALTGAARLGLRPRVISKVANDAQGLNILKEFQSDGVDTSFMVVADGISPFTYIIVDNQTKTRTCIHTPGQPPMVPDELSDTCLNSALEDAKIAYFDGRLTETAIRVAMEANRRDIPILIDAERKREGLDDLLSLSKYVVCSAKFPQAWTSAPSTPSALVSILLRLPDLKFVIVTLGEKGCIMLERSICADDPCMEEVDVDGLLTSLQQQVDKSQSTPTCIASKPNLRISADGIGAVCGRLLLGTAEVIPAEEIVDTTGAGDAFIGAVLYALCAEMPPETMLPFASQVAASGCRALGARSGLPNRDDSRLAKYFL